MAKKILIAILTVAIFSACSVSVSTAKITEMEICDYLDANQVMCDSDKTTFSNTTEELFLTTRLRYAPEGTLIIFQWRYLEEEEPILIAEVSTKTPDTSESYPNSSITAPETGIWPSGKYDVAVFINTTDSKPTVKTFVIE